MSADVSGRCQVGISRAGDSIHVNSSAIAASGLKAYGDKFPLRTDALAYGVRPRTRTGGNP